MTFISSAARRRDDKHSLVCYLCTWYATVSSLNISWRVWSLSHLPPYKWSNTIHDTGHVIPTLLQKTWCKQGTFRLGCVGILCTVLNVFFTGCTKRERRECLTRQTHDVNCLTPVVIKWHTSSVMAFIWRMPWETWVTYWLLLYFDECNPTGLHGILCGLRPMISNK